MLEYSSNNQLETVNLKALEINQVLLFYVL